MASIWAGCAVIVLFLDASVYAQGTVTVPDVNIEVLKPKGVRISIPDIPKLSLFAFNGNLNKPISDADIGTIKGEVLRESNGRWTFEDPNVTLKEGDEIRYYVFVSVDRVGYVKDNQVFRYSSIDHRNGEEQTTNCQTSQTEVRGRTSRICSGETIFEDNFDSSLSENTWQVEQYIPIDNPEFPFISYQQSAVAVVNGYLQVKPELQSVQPGFSNMSIVTDNLDLTYGCTAPACSKQASGSDILPPVLSGKVISKGFSFKYGTVHIRAKLPQGDWLYPEILLEPFLKRYGTQNYASGVLRIASARGNKELRSANTQYGNKVLYGGPIMDYECRSQLLARKESPQFWGDSFHDYSVHWGPDRIILSVDGAEWSRIEPASTGLSGRFPTSCSDLPRTLLATGSKMAPFDTPFHIALGVAVGGISEFDNGLKTGSNWPKPWQNGAHKAMLNFWKDVDNWYPTWNRGQPALMVDYVKVLAL